MESPPTTSIIAASGLTKDFGDGAGVFDLDLDIPKGSIVGFIGPSGSGKTTTIHMMTGVTSPDRGELTVMGERPAAFDRDTRARIGYMPQDALLYPDLTLLENLNFAASLYGMPYGRKDRIDELVDFVQLEGRMDRLPREASGGEKRRIMLASTFFHRPELIFLDEPTAGIDPVLRRRFWDRFSELSQEGRTLVVTTQYVGEAAYCDYVAVLAAGRMVIFDTPEGLRHAAFGGDQIEISFEQPPTGEALSSLARVFGSDDRPPERIDDRTLRLVVVDAGESIGRVSNWASENNIALQRSDVFQPEYDDVFVELMAKHEERLADVR